MSLAHSVRVDALLTGKAVPYTRPGSHSGIDKQPRAGLIRITEWGLAGDEQGDLRVHGGIDKAVHHYPFDHYSAWRSELGDTPVLQQPGAFGEFSVQAQFGGHRGAQPRNFARVLEQVLAV